jgi:hypothetical protein
MVGQSDAAVCVDGFCAVPGAASEGETAPARDEVDRVRDAEPARDAGHVAEAEPERPA